MSPLSGEPDQRRCITASLWRHGCRRDLWAMAAVAVYRRHGRQPVRILPTTSPAFVTPFFPCPPPPLSVRREPREPQLQPVSPLGTWRWQAPFPASRSRRGVVRASPRIAPSVPGSPAPTARPRALSRAFLPFGFGHQLFAPGPVELFQYRPTGVALG